MSDDESNVYPYCKDYTVYKYGNDCKDTADLSLCNNDWSEPCLMSYDFADRRKWRSSTKACRTVPESYRNELSGGKASNDDFKWGKKAKRNNNSGMCNYTDDGTCGECKFSWFADRDVDSQRWKGFSAMSRCMSLE